jgi:type IV secretory pathway TrbL component
MEGYLSLIVAGIGVLIYALSKNNAKLAECGRILFFCGVLAFLLTNGGHKAGFLQ